MAHGWYASDNTIGLYRHVDYIGVARGALGACARPWRWEKIGGHIYRGKL